MLALLPLHTAIAAAEALRRLLADATAAADPPPGVKVPTLSAGLAFVHHLTPLDRARALAKEAEAMAKAGTADDARRDALAIILDKRSGTAVAVRGAWSPPTDAGRWPRDRAPRRVPGDPPVAAPPARSPARRAPRRAAQRPRPASRATGAP